MAISAAERRALSRERAKAGLVVVTVVTNRCDLVALLEARPAFDYTDTFEQGRSYRKGQGCTQGGSIFVAMKDYPAAPGTPDSGWQLAVKRGRDAR